MFVPEALLLLFSEMTVHSENETALLQQLVAHSRYLDENWYEDNFTHRYIRLPFLSMGCWNCSHMMTTGKTGEHFSLKEQIDTCGTPGVVQ